MPESCVRVARGLLLYGPRMGRDGAMSRSQFLDTVGVKDGTFRSAAAEIGGKEANPGLRFFDVGRGRIRFGPGAGVMLGISVGTASLRAALVDANGQLWCEYPTEHVEGQLREDPRLLLERICTAASQVVKDAIADERLLVNGALPFLGVAVAWPVPVNRQFEPVGNGLLNPTWRSGQTLPQRVARTLGLEPHLSHALNDTHAAAVAVAFDRTLRPEHRDQKVPELTMVLRLAGGVGGATIAVEPPEEHAAWGPSSGFIKSVLNGGAERMAGEIGHHTMSTQLLETLNAGRPEGLCALAPFDCSCVRPGEDVPNHLEALAGAGALASRLDPGRSIRAVVQGLRSAGDEPLTESALTDVGTLVGEALLAPVAWLNPSRIEITGALALPTVRKAIDARLVDAHPFVTHPTVGLKDGPQDDYLRVRGAALVVLRRFVYRRLPALLGGSKAELPSQVRDLTLPLTKLPI